MLLLVASAITGSARQASSSVIRGSAMSFFTVWVMGFIDPYLYRPFGEELLLPKNVIASAELVCEFTIYVKK